MIKKVFLVLIFAVSLLLLSACKNPQSQADLSAKSISGICADQERTTCIKDCKDGFGETCYYDSGIHKREDLASGFLLPEVTKKACFAVNSFSVCGECYNRYELKDEPVDCETFYKAIESKNEDCGDCLDTISTGV